MRLDVEKSIREYFDRLPRRAFSVDKKQAIWLKIQSHLREKSAITNQAQEKLGLFHGFRFAKTATSALIVIIAVGLTIGVTSAAKSSLPGETLYPIKKYVVEKVEIALATSPEKKVKVLSSHAKTRLQEVATLVEENKASEEVVTETLADLKSTTAKVHEVVEQASEEKPELLDEAIELASEEEKVLATIENQAEGKAKAAIQDAITASREGVSKLKTGQDSEVEGAQTDSGVAEEDTTSTPATTLPPPKINDGVIESEIQLNDAFRTGDEDTDQEKEPTILPEPRTGF